MTLFITSINFCLPEVDLEEGKGGPRLLYSHPIHKSLVNLCTNFIVKCNFALAHENICRMYY